MRMTKEEALEEIKAAKKAARPPQLVGANLEGATIYLTCLESANLKGASLRGVDLSHSDLDNSDLTDADLSDTHMEGVMLRGATLCGINLDGAFFGDSIGGEGDYVLTVSKAELDQIRAQRKKAADDNS